MKKVIVFRVEEVLVKGNDENRLEEMRERVFVKKSVGDKVFEEEFYKEDGKKRKVVMSCGEMVVKMVEMEKRFEEEGDVVKKYWIRDVRKKLEDWEEGKEKRLVERRKKFMDEGFEKKMIGKRGELKDLERICEVTGSRMVFVSEEKRSRVGNLLYNNGLRRFEVESGVGFLEGMDEKDYVVIDSVEDLENMWKKIGLKRS
jgi:hypothetical protein